MNKRMLSLLIGLVVIAVLLVVNGCVFVVKSIEIKYETPTLPPPFTSSIRKSF